MMSARRQVIRCIVAALVALTYATLVWGQDDEIEVEYAVKSFGGWQVPVKIVQKADIPASDYQVEAAFPHVDEPGNLVPFEMPKETFKLPRYFTRDLNLTREMLNSFGRRQLHTSPMLAVSKDNFHPLCQVERALVEFQHKNYEYRPSHYHELTCKKPLTEGVDDLNVHGKCALPLLHCVQIYNELHIARRHHNTTCWEPQTVKVKSGCECMWPEHELGSPNDHY